MHIEAVNFGGMGHPEDATMLGRMRCASDAIASTNPATNGLVKQLHPSARVRLRAAASCAV
jgi:hypothetical protein